jgi:hypothetical protein
MCWYAPESMKKLNISLFPWELSMSRRLATAHENGSLKKSINMG